MYTFCKHTFYIISRIYPEYQVPRSVQSHWLLRYFASTWWWWWFMHKWKILPFIYVTCGPCDICTWVCAYSFPAKPSHSLWFLLYFVIFYICSDFSHKILFANPSYSLLITYLTVVVNYLPYIPVWCGWKVVNNK